VNGSYQSRITIDGDDDSEKAYEAQALQAEVDLRQATEASDRALADHAAAAALKEGALLAKVDAVSAERDIQEKACSVLSAEKASAEVENPEGHARVVADLSACKAALEGERAGAAAAASAASKELEALRAGLRRALGEEQAKARDAVAASAAASAAAKTSAEARPLAAKQAKEGAAEGAAAGSEDVFGGAGEGSEQVAKKPRTAATATTTTTAPAPSPAPAAGASSPAVGAPSGGSYTKRIRAAAFFFFRCPPQLLKIK